MLHHIKRFTGKTVHQAVFHLLSQFKTILENKVRRMCYVLRHVKLTLAGLVEVLTGLIQKFRMLLPHMAHLCEYAE